MKKLGKGRSDADGCLAMLTHWVTAATEAPVTWKMLILAMAAVVDLEVVKLLIKALRCKVDI